MVGKLSENFQERGWFLKIGYARANEVSEFRRPFAGPTPRLRTIVRLLSPLKTWALIDNQIDVDVIKDMYYIGIMTPTVVGCSLIARPAKEVINGESITRTTTSPP